jgi:catechol 2,3-dioxygenase-like lactoylglutathione lyase family enzyme
LHFKKEQLSQSDFKKDAGTSAIILKIRKMKVRVMSIPVQDQDKALAFYTGKLGFIKKIDVPVGGGNRWLTVVAKEEQDGPEVLLEPSPNNFEPAQIYQKALFEAGIPYTQFDVDDVEHEYERLLKLGVEFSLKPTIMGPVKLAVLNDTCGNNIQLVQML